MPAKPARLTSAFTACPTIVVARLVVSFPPAAMASAMVPSVRGGGAAAARHRLGLVLAGQAGSCTPPLIDGRVLESTSALHSPAQLVQRSGGASWTELAGAQGLLRRLHENISGKVRGSGESETSYAPAFSGRSMLFRQQTPGLA